MVQEYTLEKEFEIRKLAHMRCITGMYIAQQYIAEVEDSVNIPLFLIEDTINKKVDKKLIEITLAGELHNVYDVAYSNVQSMLK